MRGLALLLLLALVAGCLQPLDPAPGSGGLPEQSFPSSLHDLAAGLPCEAQLVGDETTENLREVAFLPLAEESGRLGALDTRGSLALVARYDEGGFHIVNIARPDEPRLLATFEAMEGPALDVKFGSDGSAALVGNLEGVALVDLRDPLSPRREAEWRFPPEPTLLAPTMAHMLYVFPWQGRDLVFVASQAGTGVWILAIEGEPGGRELRYLGRFASRLGDPIAPHDTWATFDDELGKPLLYVANGFAGWLVADVSDPERPELLGGATPQDPYVGYVHTIQAARLQGKRLVATISEVGANALKVYDASDLRAPRLLATWTSRAVPTAPQHPIQVVDRYLFLAHYRDGGYGFDLGALPALPAPGSLEPVARFVTGPDPGPLYGFEGVYDVGVEAGLVYFVERERGLHVLAFGCFEPGDAGLTSTG